MILLRIFWALFLAWFVAYAFHRTWKWEHGAPLPEPVFGGDKPRTKETAVFFAASFLPLMLLVILLMFAVADGMDGVRRFLSLSLDVMIVISIFFLLLIILLPIFRKYFSARACATMWILPVIMFWQVHILVQNAPAPSFVLYIPSNVLKMLFIIWVIGFLVVYVGKFISHFMFRHRVMSAAVPVSDPEVRKLFEQELIKLEYYHTVKLVKSSAVTVPFSMGTGKRSRVTVLPNREFTHQELQFIFRHEIHHLQRGDVNNKIFFAFCQALCWFNPLIWIATRKASDDLELSCDEIVLENMDEQKRKQYAELLLDTAGHSGGFTTCLSAAANTMRYRLKNVMTIRKRWPGTIMLSIAMFLCVMSYGKIAVSCERGTVADLITEQGTANNITGVYYQSEDSDRLEEIYGWDGNALFSYLSSLTAEKLNSANEINILGEQRLSLQMNNSGMMQIEFYDRIVEVLHFYNGFKREYFYLHNNLDWEYILSRLDFNAEKPPETVLQDPQLGVLFDVEEMTEPIIAIRNYFQACDMETDIILRSSSNSESPGGLYGLSPTHAQLIFDIPVSELNVWATEWNSDSKTAVAVKVQEGNFFITLKNESAHYQVEVLYEPCDGVRYEGVYVFDVEYPN